MKKVVSFVGVFALVALMVSFAGISKASDCAGCNAASGSCKHFKGFGKVGCGKSVAGCSLHNGCYLNCVPAQFETIEEEVTYVVKVPEWTETEESYTVKVPVCVDRETTYTVMVPNWTEKEVSYTVMVPVVTEKEVPYTVMVPNWTEKEVSYTVMVPVVTEKEVSYNVCVPTITEKEVEYTVCVPYTEQREGVRKVMQQVPVTEIVDVCVNSGYWAEEVVDVPVASCGCGKFGKCGKHFGKFGKCKAVGFVVASCGPACGCGCGAACACGCGCAAGAPCTCGSACGCAVACAPACGFVGKCGAVKVGCKWGKGFGACGSVVIADACQAIAVPQVVKRWVPTTEMIQKEITKMVCQETEVPYTYDVVLTRPETRTKIVKECTMVAEERTKIVKECSMVAEERSKIVKECSMVPEERTKIVKECSMQPEERTKTVKECTMVAEERTKIVKVMSCEDEVRTRVVKQCVMIDEVRTKTIQKQVAVASGCGIAYAVPACGFGHGCKKARACCVAPVCACSGEVIYGDLPDAPAFLGDNDEVDAPAFDADEYADTEEKDTISTEDTEEDALPSVY